MILISGLLAASASLPVCSWDKPGQNPFMGDVVAAVDRYTDIPKPIREILKKRMAKRQYDDVAEIKRNSIKGKNSYSDLREMHFGPGTVCKTITRKAWTEKHVERGLVYCEGEHCLIVPTVCRNVSKVTKKQEDPLEFETAAGPPKEEIPEPPPSQPEIILPQIKDTPLDFETAAGPQTFVPPVPTTPSIPSFSPSIPNFPSATPQTLLTFTPAVPEPGVYAMFLIGLSLIWFKIKKFDNKSV